MIYDLTFLSLFSQQSGLKAIMRYLQSSFILRCPSGIKGVLHPQQKLAYFVLYLKIINTV